MKYMSDDTTPLVKCKRKKVTDEVFDQMITLLRQNHWTVGTKLPSENDLRIELGVSRFTIREVMNRLGTLGWIETKQGEGSYVKSVPMSTFTNILMPFFMLEKHTMLEILEYRRIVEFGSFEIAISKMNDAVIKELEEITNRMEHNDYSDEEFAKDDLKWHLIINTAAGNKLLYKSTQMVLDLLNESMREVVYKLGREDGRHYHRIITDALKNHEYEKALNEMKEHLVLTINKIMANY